MTTEQDDVAEFARLFRGFLERMQQPPSGIARENLRERLMTFLEIEPEGLPVVAADFPSFDLPNVQLAIESWFDSYELVGLIGMDRGHLSLAELLDFAGRERFGIGAVDYQRISIDVDEELDCVSFGIYLGRQGDDRYVALLRAANPQYGRMSVMLEILASTRAAGERFLGALPELIRDRNVFRGKVVSFEEHKFASGVGPFRLHRRPGISRADVVLPEGVLERVEREVIGIAEHRETLRQAGQHLRRGVLLHGPPGTGKTHTVRYLLSRLPEFTVVLLAGMSISFISEACGLARKLQPALVVLEDCDLIAESRDFMHGRGNPLLFQVLNEMDGLAEEADVAFLLTTNRADILEPALAQRPGRVDLAVEIPLPDAAGRARLLKLYGPGLELTPAAVEEVVARTEGTTASFAKELVRRAVLLAAESGTEAGDTEIKAAAAELLSARDALTRRLLGGSDADSATSADGAGEATSWSAGPARPGIYPGAVGWEL